jgi:formylglycine-generating enzyme required for sulfatase activity
MDKFPVTQGLYEKVMGKEKNISSPQSWNRPVVNVTWFEAIQFCNLLSDKMNFTQVYDIEGEVVTPNWHANGYRLPTEAEWEYACKAGTTLEQYEKIDQIAWYKANSNKSTQGVGGKNPNPWGLYDMLGNVWEWCWDWHAGYPKEKNKVWPGPKKGDKRIVRGGSWYENASTCQATFRHKAPPSYRDAAVGFRIARSL